MSAVKEYMYGKFVKLVAELREDQRRYFKTRDKYYLRCAIVEERKVDEMLEKFSQLAKA